MTAKRFWDAEQLRPKRSGQKLMCDRRESMGLVQDSSRWICWRVDLLWDAGGSALVMLVYSIPSYKQKPSSSRIRFAGIFAAHVSAYPPRLFLTAYGGICAGGDLGAVDLFPRNLSSCT